MHLIWKSDFENEPVYTRASIENAKDLKGIRITACEPLAGVLPELRVAVTSDYPPADYFNAGPLMLVSERLKSVLLEHGARAEFLAVVLTRNGKPLDFGSYYVFNLLGKVDCLDYERAVYQMDGEFVDKIERLAIDEGKAQGHAVCRLDRCFDVITAADQKLAQAIQGQGLTGMKFIDAAEWQW